VKPTFEFDLEFGESYMPYVNPATNSKLSAVDSEVEPKTVEEEITRMEKYKREMIKKIGGEKYNRIMARLIKRKQKGYR
jgi:hypothetical protein